MGRVLTLCVLLGVLAVVGGFALPVGADPPDEPNHGVNETRFDALWSGDVDSDDPPEDARNDSAMNELAAYTDIAFDDPPEAVERWNDGDHGEFPNTSWRTSIHPRGTSLSDGIFVKDSYVELFAIQPSTRVHQSPNGTDLYVAPEGRLLATTDYRIVPPGTHRYNETTITWSVDEHRIEETRLLVNDTIVSTAGNTHTPELPYDSLDEYNGETVTLTVETDIYAGLWRENETCLVRINESVCDEFSRKSNYVRGQHTVETSVDVTVHSLTSRVTEARHPSGRRSFAVHASEPWRGYTVGETTVNGIWQFYSARDPRWDTLVASTSTGRETWDSPMHPLRVNAFPSSLGASISPDRTGEPVTVYGNTTTPPSLHPTLDFDVVTSPYETSQGLVTGVDAVDTTTGNITAYGMVRGVQDTQTADSFASVEVSNSSLTLTVKETTPENVTLAISLQETETGAPIDTSARSGSIVVDGESVNTNVTGTVRLTVPRTAGAVSARYDPAPWWQGSSSYTPDTDTVYVEGAPIDLLGILYRMAIPIGSLLLGVYIIERITGWRVIRFWRR